jgi:hypothetical protein
MAPDLFWRRSYATLGIRMDACFRRVVREPGSSKLHGGKPRFVLTRSDHDKTDRQILHYATLGRPTRRGNLPYNFERSVGRSTLRTLEL